MQYQLYRMSLLSGHAGISAVGTYAAAVSKVGYGPIFSSLRSSQSSTVNDLVWP